MLRSDYLSHTVLPTLYWLGRCTQLENIIIIIIIIVIFFNTIILNIIIVIIKTITMNNDINDWTKLGVGVDRFHCFEKTIFSFQKRRRKNEKRNDCF